MGGGGSDEPDVNKTTISQQALWGQYAKDWNTYLRDVEPRVEAAYAKSANLPETQSRIQNQMKLSTLDKASPISTLGNKQSLTTNLLRSNAGLGSALAGSEVKGAESARDYQAGVLGNILASKMGSKTSTQTALCTFASCEVSNYLKGLESNTAINNAMGQAGSSALFGIGQGLYAGAAKANSNTGTT